MLDLVELESQARKKPAQLSGGQQQRVALARALINSPEVLLLDEPLGALDLKLRRAMQIEIKRIQTEVGLTFVHVTHDQEEAMTMADTIAVMNAGVIEQMGAPAELYDNPQTTFVANFLGQSNLIEGTVRGRDGDVVKVDMQGTSPPSRPSGPTSAAPTASWAGSASGPRRCSSPRSASRSTPRAAASRGEWSATSASSASARSTSCGCRGARRSRSSSRTPGADGCSGRGSSVDISWRPEYAFLLDHNQDATAGVDKEDAES